MLKGYDLGGAEYPIIEEGVEYTVVDQQDPDWECVELPPGKFIKQDLREDFSHLEPVDRIWIGGMLRYLTIESGWLDGMEVGYREQVRFAERLDKILKPGGRVTIRDHLEVCSYILEELVIEGYKIESLELSNPSDQDLPSDWVINLLKSDLI